MPEDPLDIASRKDMESFGNFDAETFRSVHHPDAVMIYPDGQHFRGVETIMEALSGHFENKNATWEYTELYRAVSDNQSAFLLYDTTYAVPSEGYRHRALVGVTWTCVQGTWLSIADQATIIG